jgi:hypothetical protein
MELPKKKSLADLGLDSLGFVSDTDEGEDSGQDEDTGGGTSHERRGAARPGHLEGEGGGIGRYHGGYEEAGSTHEHVQWSHGSAPTPILGAEQQQQLNSEFSGGSGFYSQATAAAQAGFHQLRAGYEHFPHPGTQPHDPHPQQYIPAEGAVGYAVGGWSQHHHLHQPYHHHHHQFHPHLPPQPHGQYPSQHASYVHRGGEEYYGDEEDGGDVGVGHVVDEYGYAWEDTEAGELGYGWEDAAAGGLGYGAGGDDLDLDEHEFLSFLQESFPGFNLESLEELLAANNGDISLTVEMLTDMGTDERPLEPPPLDDESNFPTLGGGGGGGGDDSGKGNLGGQPATRGTATSTQVEDAPSSPPSEIFRSFTISGGRSNVRGGAAVSASASPSSQHHHHLSAGGFATDENSNFAARLRTQGTVPAPLGSPTEQRGSVQIGYGTGNFGGQRSHAAAAQQPWVETGEAVSSMYASTREDARDHCRLRNVCFQQATQAYLSGNKALAKELSRKGRTHAQAMRAAHDVAAGTIFRERNANILHSTNGSAGSGAGGGPRMFDLHGLHVAEAVAVLRRELPHCRASGERVVHVLVGTGHHVKGSRTPARLPAAVAEFLHTSRIRFWEPQAGMLEVDIASVVG